MTRQVFLAAIMIFSLGHTACSGDDTSIAFYPDPTAKALVNYTPFVGEWKVSKQTCGASTRDLSKPEWIIVGSGVESIEHVVRVEENVSQRCERSEVYTFLLTSGTQSEKDGTTIFMQEGEFLRSEVRVVCWRKANGAVERSPFKNQSVEVSGPSFTGAYIQSMSNRMIFQSPSSVICDGRSTLLELSKE